MPLAVRGLYRLLNAPLRPSDSAPPAYNILSQICRASLARQAPYRFVNASPRARLAHYSSVNAALEPDLSPSCQPLLCHPFCLKTAPIARRGAHHRFKNAPLGLVQVPVRPVEAPLRPVNMIYLTYRASLARRVPTYILVNMPIKPEWRLPCRCLMSSLLLKLAPHRFTNVPLERGSAPPACYTLSLTCMQGTPGPGTR